ncbi:ABC transporter substrate-binding protein [Deinococcus sp. YIM 134068]|uniref:ABC transporter substrate-binding protein n=1 Tax=Deinococcus lichenicola TaxID=3118910 RepID=UPI002F95EFE5
MKKTLFLLTVALLGQAGAQAVTLDLWAHWGSEQRRPTINRIIETWNKKNPNIQVKYTFVPFDQLPTKTLAAVAAKSPPDVVVIDIRTTPLRAAKNQASNLSRLGAESLRAQFYPNLWATATYKGDQYGLPFVTDTRFLYYNKDLFREVGLNPNKPPKTWEELDAYARKLDRKTGPVYSRIGFHPLYGNFGLESWVANAGGSIWNEDLTAPRFTNPTAVRTLGWLKDWTDRLGARNVQAFRSSFGSGAQDPFITGKLGMIADIGGYAATLKRYAPNLNYGMVRMPTPTGQPGPGTSSGGGFNLEVPVGSKHPKEAYAFARWMATEGARIWAVEQNDFPGAKNASLSVTTPAFRLMSANMKYTLVSSAPPLAPGYASLLEKSVEDAVYRGQDARQALEEAQTQVQRVIDSNK